MEIFNRKKNVIKEGASYSKEGVNSQINFEIDRGFVDPNEISKINNLEEKNIGDKIHFLIDKKTRVIFEKTSKNVFKVLEQDTNGILNNPRNNPTPSGAYDQSFGRQFMATGGNSIPQNNTHIPMRGTFVKNWDKHK